MFWRLSHLVCLLEQIFLAHWSLLYEKMYPKTAVLNILLVGFSKSLTQILCRNCALYDNSGARSGEATEGQDSYICSSGNKISLPFLHRFVKGRVRKIKMEF